MARTIIALVFCVFVLVSCAAREETITRPEPPPEPGPVTAVKPPPPPEKPQWTRPEPLPSAPKLRSSFRCEEDTGAVFNSCGLEALPFIRTVFFDIDNDGSEEMIAGSKDGLLRVYRNTGTASGPKWVPMEYNLDGIQAGAFSAPAIGDLDNDGRPEMVFGTGG